jgi:hypothetical protein
MLYDEKMEMTWVKVKKSDSIGPIAWLDSSSRPLCSHLRDNVTRFFASSFFMNHFPPRH